MARSYKRDSKGRFASSGGGGGGGGSKAKAPAAPKSKAGQTRAANAARDKKLLGMGMTGAGSRMHGAIAKKYSGTKQTKNRNATLWTNVGDMKKNRATGYSSPPTKAPKRSGTISRRRSSK